MRVQIRQKHRFSKPTWILHRSSLKKHIETITKSLVERLGKPVGAPCRKPYLSILGALINGLIRGIPEKSLFAPQKPYCKPYKETPKLKPQPLNPKFLDTKRDHVLLQLSSAAGLGPLQQSHKVGAEWVGQILPLWSSLV